MYRINVGGMDAMAVRYVLLFSLLLSVAGATLDAAAQQRVRTPDGLLKKMAEKYASIRSYEDEGVVETVTESPTPTRTKEVGFKLYFSRPRRLRFEWVQFSPPTLNKKSMVWSDGVRSFGLYSFEPDKVESKESLGLVLSGAAGLSLGSAITIPNLLSDEVGGFTLGELARVSLKGRERFEGEDCYVLEGYHPDGSPWRLWLGAKDLLLRKLSVRLPTDEIQEEIHRNIKVNESIPAETFRPRVPGGLVALLDR